MLTLNAKESKGKPNESKNKVWKYENLTKGSEMETNDLRFLLQHINDRDDIEVGDDIMVDLILRGKAEGTVQDEDGNMYRIRITEYNI